MLRAGADDIDPRRIDTAVTENVCELGDVLLNTVKHTGEQVAQVVWKHLIRIDVRFLAQRFHIPPDIRPADRLATARDEDTARFDPLLRCVAEQFLLQVAHDKHRARFALAGNRRFAALCSFHGDELQFANAYRCRRSFAGSDKGARCVLPSQC